MRELRFRDLALLIALESESVIVSIGMGASDESSLANERVRVKVGKDEIVIGWDERQQLLERARRVAGTEALVDAFDRVGTSRPRRARREEVVEG